MRRGEPAAMGRFFELCFDRIYGLAFRLTGDRTLAEDATQEVCYRIQRAAPTLDIERDPAPWVLAITVNTCRSIWRSSASRVERASRSIHDDSGRAPEPDDPAPGPDEVLLAGERVRLVQQALLELDLPLREVVLLRDYEGRDHREIASMLGLSHSAARKRYSRALAGLALRLKGMLE
jgi:RNA polymerase sigma-70 factor (ECF subfamily)